ncbi:MAG: glutamate racemase [Candidatus Fluviicola riflensis]|nr:MAG: glutamate racemase [Candidatus Fluviicola riflensis]OGS77654.1 MAG: glutamate racemase [Candidatus Fluviicola riflensis]OGS84237.1 MAG: glutamate racemase [Fluviicola sp. RIFCSPHIGHO2_12_FULL_43_24]OGS84720.1 MAG: glutamate racemase [Fluviicola sp. RIFCSPHIGHO2_01_FULL_43_53]
MSKKGPIGIFDSGYGGLTVLKEIREQLPQYDYLYLGDNARAPYGSRSFEVIYDYTWQAVQALFEQGCSLVILACNTASAKALRSIQQKQLPLLAENKRVLGVIRPSTEALGEMTHSKHIGILATEGTVKSQSYVIELQKFAPEITVTQHACPMWVPLIENNQHTTPGGIYFLQQDLLSLLQQDPKIDTILLGCTHYPLVKETLQSLLPEHIQVVAQGSLVAAKLEDYLLRHPEIESLCQKGGNVTYVTTESASDFSINASRIMGLSIDAEHITLH